MRILVDESLSRHLVKMLAYHVVESVQGLGWAGIKNGDLIAKADDLHEVFLTADRNLRYQQNLTGRRIAIVIFPSNKLSIVKLLHGQLGEALTSIRSGEFVELSMPKRN